MLHPSLLVISHRDGGWIDLPLRETFSPVHPLAYIFHPPYSPLASQAISRNVPVSQASAFNSSHLSLRKWPRLPFTARIERAQFHRARSASKKGTWPLPSTIL